MANKYNIPEAKFIELVKLSDLVRIFGKIRTRLYYDVGFDTLEKIAEEDYLEFREKIKRFIEKNKLKYIHPTHGEALWAVKCARLRPKLIKYK